MPSWQVARKPNGNVRYPLKTPYRDGTTHVIFEPMDFIARLTARVPEPRVNLTRVHGVFAPKKTFKNRLTTAARVSQGPQGVAVARRGAHGLQRPQFMEGRSDRGSPAICALKALQPQIANAFGASGEG